MRKAISAIVLVVILVMTISVVCYAQDQKIGFVDRRTIAFEYNKIKELNASIEQEYEQAKAQIEEKTNEIRKMSEDMELLSESARQEKEPELQEKIRAFDNFRREKMQELGKKRDEGMMAISEEIEQVSKAYGKSNGYFALIDKAAALYAPEEADVTGEILAQLNK